MWKKLDGKTVGCTVRFWGPKVNKWRYFKDEEVKGLDTELVAGADKARHNSGIPWTLTDTVRTPDMKDENAVKNSAHLTGHAFDVRCQSNNALYLMLRGLYSAEFKRFGIYFTPDPRGKGLLLPTHIHADNDTTKPQEVVFCSLEK